MSVTKTAMFCFYFLYFSYVIFAWEVLKRIIFRNPAKVLAVERDVIPRNMNFAKAEKRGGGN